MFLISENSLCFSAKGKQGKAWSHENTGCGKEPKEGAGLRALREGECLVSGIETSPFEACLSLLLSNLRPHQRAGNVTRALLRGVGRQRGWLARYTLKCKWQRAINLLINHQLKHLPYFYGQRDRDSVGGITHLSNAGWSSPIISKRNS